MMPVMGEYSSLVEPPEGSVVEDDNGALWERISEYPISWQKQYDSWNWDIYPWGPDLESWFYVNGFGPLKLIRWGYDD